MRQDEGGLPPQLSIRYVQKMKYQLLVHGGTFRVLVACPCAVSVLPAEAPMCV